MSGPTEKEIRERLGRISEIFTDIVKQADEQSQTRCPYRDRLDRCTGRFRCRNQLPRADLAGDGAPPPDADEFPYLCTHDGRFDYRDAWESQPRSVERAKERIGAIRREARARREDAEEG